MKRVCAHCEEEFLGTGRQKYCGFVCREVARNRELQEKWVNRKERKVSLKNKSLLQKAHLTPSPSYLKKFQSCRG